MSFKSKMESFMKAESATSDTKDKCPPHDLYESSSDIRTDRDGKRVKYRTDRCRRAGCNFSHSYETRL